MHCLQLGAVTSTWSPIVTPASQQEREPTPPGPDLTCWDCQCHRVASPFIFPDVPRIRSIPQGYSPPEYPWARHSSCHTHLPSGYSLIRCIHSTQYEIVLANPRRPLRMSGAHHVSADRRCLEVYTCVPQNAREPLRPEIDDNCTWLWTGDHSWHHQPASLPQVIMNHITGSRARSQLGATVHPWTWCMMRGRITGTCCSVTSTLPWLAHGSQHQLW